MLRGRKKWLMGRKWCLREKRGKREKEEKTMLMIITTEVPPVSTKSCGSDSNNAYLAAGNC